MHIFPETCSFQIRLKWNNIESKQVTGYNIKQSDREIKTHVNIKIQVQWMIYKNAYNIRLL